MIVNSKIARPPKSSGWAQNQTSAPRETRSHRSQGSRLNAAFSQSRLIYAAPHTSAQMAAAQREAEAAADEGSKCPEASETAAKVAAPRPIMAATETRSQSDTASAARITARAIQPYKSAVGNSPAVASEGARMYGSKFSSQPISGKTSRIVMKGSPRAAMPSRT